MGGDRFFNYAPFSNNLNMNYWTSTTYNAVSSYAMAIGNQQAVGMRAVAKTSNYNGYACRTFTVTGTTLT